MGTPVSIGANKEASMTGRLALVGGDEFRPGCEAMDEAILGATGKANPVVLVAPTAAAFEMPERGGAERRGAFRWVGGGRPSADGAEPRGRDGYRAGCGG